MHAPNSPTLNYSGEAFLSRSIFPLIKHAFSKRLGIAIETNATVANEKAVLYLKNMGLVLLRSVWMGPIKAIRSA